jgi:glutaredoxin-related protein
MMPKFIKDLFPMLEKPEPAVTITAKAPSALIDVAGKGMSLIGPIFNLEAIIQAFVFNLGSYDVADVQADIASTVASAPVVIYTYPLSPFSTEAVSVLESTGCSFREVPLGLEWFALGPRGSATRVELRKLNGQGSLPHVYIGGEWVGGLATGAEGGLSGLVERGELIPKLKKARAL